MEMKKLFARVVSFRYRSTHATRVVLVAILYLPPRAIYSRHQQHPPPPPQQHRGTRQFFAKWLISAYITITSVAAGRPAPAAYCLTKDSIFASHYRRTAAAAAVAAAAAAGGGAFDGVRVTGAPMHSAKLRRASERKHGPTGRVYIHT